MSEIQQDANTGGDTGNADSQSSELARALDAVKPSPDQGVQNTGQQQQKPTGSTQSTTEKVPWHKDPRWQEWETQKTEYSTLKQQQESWTKEKETLAQTAQKAQIWETVIKEHPQIAEMIVQYAQNLEKGTKETGNPQYDSVAEQLMNSKPFKALMDKINGVEQTLNGTKEQVYEQKFNNVLGQYQAQFKTLLGDEDIPEPYRPLMQRQIWEELQKEDPDSIRNLKYSPKSFENAFKRVMENYRSLESQIASRATTKVMKTATPKTQSGGGTSVLQQGNSQDDITNDFVEQIKRFAG